MPTHDPNCRKILIYQDLSSNCTSSIFCVLYLPPPVQIYSVYNRMNPRGILVLLAAQDTWKQPFALSCRILKEHIKFFALLYLLVSQQLLPALENNFRITSYSAPICLDHFFQSNPIFKMNILINTSTHI